MTEDAESSIVDEHNSPSHHGVSSTLSWLVASVICTLTISLAFAHAPTRIRLIGLFSIAFGLLVGWLTSRLAAQCDAQISQRVRAIVAAGLAFAGLTASTWETYRLETVQLARSGKEGLAVRMLEEFNQQSQRSSITTNPSPISAFRRYLSRRVRQLGDWASPWPECFWLAELAAATVASGWISKM